MCLFKEILCLKNSVLFQTGQVKVGRVERVARGKKYPVGNLTYLATLPLETRASALTTPLLF